MAPVRLVLYMCLYMCCCGAFAHRGDRVLAFDWIADTGDGYASTVSVLALSNLPELSVQRVFADCIGYPWCVWRFAPMNEWLTTRRPSVMVLGGDLAYPYPHRQALQSRLLTPLTETLSNVSVALTRPEHRIAMVDWMEMVEYRYQFEPTGFPSDLYHFGNQSPDPKFREILMIPGNHDMLDYRAVQFHFLESSSLPYPAAYRTEQTRPYFCREAGVADNWLLMGLHDQQGFGVAPDIDFHQLKYFMQCLSSTDAYNVILMFHSPFFLLHEGGGHPGERAQSLISSIYASGKRIRVIIAAHAHHYLHYSGNDDAPLLIVCGGGGAFTETTLHVKRSVVLQLGGDSYSYSLDYSFPSINEAFGSLSGFWSICIHPTNLGNSIIVVFLLQIFWRRPGIQAPAKRYASLINQTLFLLHLGLLTFSAVYTRDLFVFVRVVFSGLPVVVASTIERSYLKHHVLNLKSLGLGRPIGLHFPVLILSLSVGILFKDRLNFTTLVYPELLYGSLLLWIFLAFIGYLHGVHELATKKLPKYSLERHFRPIGLLQQFASYLLQLLELGIYSSCIILLWMLGAFACSFCISLYAMILQQLHIFPEEISSLFALASHKSFLRFVFGSEGVTLVPYGILDTTLPEQWSQKMGFDSLFYVDLPIDWISERVGVLGGPILVAT